MKTLLFLPFLLSITACNPTKTESVTSGGVANPNAPHIWANKTFPKTVYLSDDFTADEVTNITSMSTAWSNAISTNATAPVTFFNHPNYPAAGYTVTNKSNTVTNSDQLRDELFAIYKTTNWPDDMPNALAVTQLFGTRYNVGKSDEYLSIVHADIMVNYDNHDFRTNDTLINNFYDLQTVILHEMGHFIGLGHRGYPTPKASTVMYPSINDEEHKRYPKSIDIVDVADKYNISLTSANPALATQKKEYKAKDAGTEVKMLIELYPDGECVHRENGVVIGRHPANVKLKN